MYISETSAFGTQIFMLYAEAFLFECGVCSISRKVEIISTKTYSEDVFLNAHGNVKVAVTYKSLRNCNETFPKILKWL
jgi:hypothetical protein